MSKPKVKTSGGRGASRPREAFVSDQQIACFEHFSKVAEAIPDAKLPVCKLDVVLVRQNAARGLAAMRPHLDALRERMPLVSIPDLLEIPSIAHALMFSAGQIYRAASKKEIAARLKSLRPMRKMALAQLEIFGQLGLIAKNISPHIRRGYGPADAASDAVHIVAVFRENAAKLAGKHPFTKEQLDRLSEDGAWLMRTLTPKGARRWARPRNPASVLRDKLFALLRARYDELLRAAVVVFGYRKASAHVPPLGACKRPRKRAAKVSAATVPESSVFQGSGDYSTERHETLPDDVDEIAAAIFAKQRR